MARYLLKASDGDFDRWRLAAAASDAPSLAAWIRERLNAAVGSSGYLLTAAEAELRVVADAAGPGAVVPVRRVGGEFRPDFGKRLKP